MGRYQTLEQRFWSKVDKRGPDECWPWTGAVNQHGRGSFYLDGRSRIAAQVSWQIATGKPFPPGKNACHSCDNPNCVNDAHIWPGTQSENLKDCVAKGRLPIVPNEFCSRGHPKSGDNAYVSAGRGIRCKQCHREAGRVYDARRRAAKKAMLQSAINRKGER